MTRAWPRVTWIAAILTASSLMGCGKDSQSAASPKTTGPAATGNTDPDDVPITEADVAIPATYAEAVIQIAKYRDQIQAAIERGTPTKAHRPLDELDIVLKKLMPLARDSGIPKAQWQELNTATKMLDDSFNKLHAAIDRKQPPDYGAVEEAIHGALGTLQRAADAASSSPE